MEAPFCSPFSSVPLPGGRESRGLGGPPPRTSGARARKGKREAVGGPGRVRGVATAWPNEWNVHEEAVPGFVGPRRDQLDL